MSKQLRRFSLVIHVSGPHDVDAERANLARLLRRAAWQLGNESTASRELTDTTGNHAGYWKLETVK